MGRARDWLIANHPVITGLAALIAIFTTLILGFRWAFDAPDVAVRIERSDIELPPSVVEDMMSVTDSSAISLLPDSLQQSLEAVESFLLLTKNYAKIAISNNTRQSIHNIDLRVMNLSQVYSYAVSGDALTGRDLQVILDKISFDAESRILTARGIERLPPKTTLELFIWGDERLPFLIDADPVTVTYDGGAGEIVRQETVTGFDAFFYKHSGFLVLLLLLLNASIVLYLSEKNKTDTPESP
jgi:hypothetical protein